MYGRKTFGGWNDSSFVSTDASPSYVIIHTTQRTYGLFVLGSSSFARVVMNDDENEEHDPNDDDDIHHHNRTNPTTTIPTTIGGSQEEETIIGVAVAVEM